VATKYVLLLCVVVRLCESREGEKPQNDEDDMGMTYDELGVYGRLRKVVRCGPVAMFRHCCQLWRDKYDPQTVANKVGAACMQGTNMFVKNIFVGTIPYHTISYLAKA
jgi:hypothetical protein